MKPERLESRLLFATQVVSADLAQLPQGTDQSVEVPQFNPALGTLTAVSITFANPTGEGNTFTVSREGNSGPPTVYRWDVTRHIVIGGDAGEVFNFTGFVRFEGDLTVDDPDDVYLLPMSLTPTPVANAAPFVGAGTIELDVSADDTGFFAVSGSTTGIIERRSTYDGEVQVNYTYDEATTQTAPVLSKREARRLARLARLAELD